jgi:hypothetical protein
MTKLIVAFRNFANAPKTSTLYSHCVNVFYVDLRTSNDFCLIYKLTDWFCTMEVESIYCALRTEYFNRIDTFRL